MTASDERGHSVVRVELYPNRAEAFEAAGLSDKEILRGRLDWSESRAPYAGVVRGFETVREWFEQVSEAFTGYGVERRDLTDCGQNLATLWKVRDGKVASGKLFQSRAEALEAAGWRE